MPRLTSEELNQRLGNFLSFLDKNNLYTLRTDNVRLGYTVLEVIPEPGFKGVSKAELVEAFKKDGFELRYENVWVDGVTAMEFIKDLDERRMESVHVVFVCTFECIPLIARYNFWKE